MQPDAWSNIATILAIGGAGGAIFAGIGFGWAQFKAGGDKYKDNTIDSLKESLQISEDKNKKLSEEKATLINSHQIQINTLNDQMGELRGLYKAAEASKKEYLAILQGRDPAQQKFMEYMMKAAENSNAISASAQKYMTDSIVALGEIRTFMQNINSTTAAIKARNQEVDKKKKRAAQVIVGK